MIRDIPAAITGPSLGIRRREPSTAPFPLSGETTPVAESMGA
jgi:hypothetical protein